MLYGQYKKRERKNSTIRPAHAHTYWWHMKCANVCECMLCAQKRFIVCVLVCIFDIDSMSITVRCVPMCECVSVCARIFMKSFFYFGLPLFSVLFHSIEIHSYNNIL